MDDPKIDELCKRVYKNHRQALQLIYERFGSPMAGLVADIAETIGKDEWWHLVNRTSKTVVFIPKAWLDVFPPIGARPTFDNRVWVVLRLDCGRKGCHFGVSVWPTTNPKLRRAVIEQLISNPDKFGCSVHGKLTDRWTRLHRTVVARWNEGDEPETNSILDAVQKKLDDVKDRLAGVPEALRPIFAEQTTPAGSP